MEPEGLLTEGAWRGEAVTGYQIHHGRVAVDGGDEEFLDGCRSGSVYGTTWHGLFDRDRFRRAFLAHVAASCGRGWRPGTTSFATRRDERLDALGDLVEEHLDVDGVRRLLEDGVPSALPTLEVALRSDRSGAEYRAALASALEEVERLVRLAEDLLLLSRSSAGPESPRARVELEGLVLDVADVGARLAKDGGVAVRVGSVAPVAVLGDAGALRRALLNLVENGLKYTPAGGRVEISVAATDSEAEIAVDDTGPGIDPRDAERIFEPFVRLDAARDRESGGSGLGLAIARSIVVAHRGTLQVALRETGGSRFTIRLPLA